MLHGNTCSLVDHLVGELHAEDDIALLVVHVETGDQNLIVFADCDADLSAEAHRENLSLMTSDCQSFGYNGGRLGVLP